MTDYKSCAAFVDDALGAIATYGTADYVENRGSERFLHLVACLKRIDSKILFPILKKAVADDETFDAGTAASVDEKYYATGEDLFPLFVADSARSPDEQLLLQEDAIFSDMADRVIREVAPHLAPERLEGAPLEVILDFTEHLSVVGRDSLVNAFEAVLGDDFCKLFAKPQDRDGVFQMVKHRWGGRPVKFVITGRDHYNAQNPGFYRDTDWFWYGMHGLFAGVRGVDVINRTKRA